MGPPCVLVRVTLSSLALDILLLWPLCLEDRRELLAEALWSATRLLVSMTTLKGGLIFLSVEFRGAFGCCTTESTPLLRKVLSNVDAVDMVVAVVAVITVSSQLKPFLLTSGNDSDECESMVGHTSSLLVAALASM